MFADRVEEGVADGLRGDSRVGADVQGVAGVVIEPGDDLGICALGQRVVGEVGLSGLIGLLGLEADVGAFRALRRCGCDLTLAGEGHARAHRHEHGCAGRLP